MPKIVIFDSGVGGLTIYQEIKRQLPTANYIFVSDNAAFPYGTKSEQDLISRVTKVIDDVVQKYGPDLLVIACNTASTIVLPLLRNKLSIPVVGVVPAIKPAAEKTKSKIIGLLATPATINRVYTEQLINEFAADCNVVRVGSSRLVEIAEQSLYGNNVEQSVIAAELTPFFIHDDLDSLVLACTHFPLLNKEIMSVFGSKKHSIQLIDSAFGVTKRVVHLLSSVKDNEANSHQQQLLSSVAVFTQKLTSHSIFAQKLSNIGLSKIETLM